MSLLDSALQPPLLTILSSSSSPAISPLWSITTDPKLESESCVIVLDDACLAPASKWDRKSGRTYVPKRESPAMDKTFIQAGISSVDFKRRLAKGKGREGTLPLGITLPWIHLQLRCLGRRHMSFEVGIVDARGRDGVVRCSTFKKSPTLHPYRSPPLIHLPVQLPSPGPSTLTPWNDISLNLGNLLPLFQILPRPLPDPDDPIEPRKGRRMGELPAGVFANVSYLRVYANCRLRRIWFTQEGDKPMREMGVEEELAMFAANDAP